MKFRYGRQHVAFVAALLVIFASTITSSARQAASGNQMPAVAPGAAEMQRLKFYLGEWQYTEVYPNGAKNTGVYTSKLGPGGNSLINTFHSQGPVGDFEGLLVMTWDLKEKAYKVYVLGNELPGATVQTGAFEGDALVYRGQLAVGAQTLTMKNVTRLISADEMESDTYSSTNGGPEKLLVHVRAVRKRS